VHPAGDQRRTHDRVDVAGPSGYSSSDGLRGFDELAAARR
jgi:murein DD-endopeptidase MepM/ murein hydrolase activator NlpD